MVFVLSWDPSEIKTDNLIPSYNSALVPVITKNITSAPELKFREIENGD